MKRFKLSRKEKLLFATPLLVLLGLAWPMVSVSSFERTLRDLAGPQAVDCGTTTSRSPYNDPCAVVAFKAGKPFMVRYNLNPTDPTYLETGGVVQTSQGQLYWVSYYREHLAAKASLSYYLYPNAKIATSATGQPHIVFEQRKNATNTTRVWW